MLTLSSSNASSNARSFSAAPSLQKPAATSAQPFAPDVLSSKQAAIASAQFFAATQKPSPPSVMARLAPSIGAVFEVADQMQGVNETLQSLDESPSLTSSARMYIISAGAVIVATSQAAAHLSKTAGQPYSDVWPGLVSAVYHGSMTGMQAGGGALLALDAIVKACKHKENVVVSAGAILGAASGFATIMSQMSKHSAYSIVPFFIDTLYNGALMGARIGGAALFAAGLLSNVQGRKAESLSELKTKKSE